MSWEGEERRSSEYRISRIEQELSNLVVLLEQDIKARNEFRDRIERIVGGNAAAIFGNDKGLGLNSRVSTLEEAYRNHQKNIRWAWGTLGALVIHQLWKVFSLSFVK